MNGSVHSATRHYPLDSCSCSFTKGHNDEWLDCFAFLNTRTITWPDSVYNCLITEMKRCLNTDFVFTDQHYDKIFNKRTVRRNIFRNWFDTVHDEILTYVPLNLRDESNRKKIINCVYTKYTNDEKVGKNLYYCQKRENEKVLEICNHKWES